MRNIYLFLLMIFSGLQTNAQIVDIPDPAFKTELLSLSGIDANNDGEIQVSEAQAVHSISLSLCTLDNTIGIQSFVNLENFSISAYCQIATPVDLSGMSAIKTLNFHKCTVPSVNISGLTALESISIGYSTITFLNASDAVNLESYSLYESGATSVDLSPFPNLTDFTCQSTPLASVNLSGLANLLSFKLVQPGEITTLDLHDLTSLTTFELSGADLLAIDFSNNLQLEEITVTGDGLSALDVSMLPNLAKLFCYSNNLTALDVSANTNLEQLHCGENQLASLDLGNLHKLQYVDLSYNLFTAIDFGGFSEIGASSPLYNVSNNPNLVSVSIKNGKQDSVPMYGLNCPNLVYLCLDDSDFEGQTNELQQSGITGLQINTYCSFVPGGNYNTITGTVSLDNDNNGCDANDYKMPGIKVALAGENQNGITYTDENGNYTFYTQAGDFTVTPAAQDTFFTVSPSAATASFADVGDTQSENFCITSNGTHNDLEITLIPTQVARPGFDAHYRLAYSNKGSQVLSGNIAVAFNDAVLDFVTSNPAVGGQALNELNWNFSDLLPSENRTIDFILNVNSPMETPPVNNGDILNFSATIDPSTDDETPSDNIAALDQTVLGSFDPNDKTCLEGTTMTPEMVGDYLHYVIRFQNSGTFLAENVVVKDVIDPAKFDISTLELTSASHSYVARIAGDTAEFIFEGINLPAESDDEPGSHGYVAFKIKTKSDLVLDDSVSNTADIFFDYNFPITTNPAVTTVSLLGLSQFGNASVSMTPNPVKSELRISAETRITSIQLFDLQGRLLRAVSNNDNFATIDFTGKAPGVYIVKVYTEKGVKVQKIIKQ